MAINGDSAIWRDDVLETNATDKLEFNEGAVINTDGNIMNSSFVITTGIARNERPGAIDKLQDTGVNGVTVTITGTISDPEGDDSTAHTFKTWLLEAKTVDGTFPKGRFGLRLNDFRAFNMSPSTTKGYMVESVDFRRDGETKGKLSFVLVLRFNGEIGTKSDGEYNW
jgi:hypothetical protein